MKMNKTRFKKVYRILEDESIEMFLIDPGGSYTGKPRDFDVPVQDVDDL